MPSARFLGRVTERVDDLLAKLAVQEKIVAEDSGQALADVDANTTNSAKQKPYSVAKVIARVQEQAGDTRACFLKRF